MNDLKDFAEEYIKKGEKKFGRKPTYEEIEEIINEEEVSEDEMLGKELGCKCGVCDVCKHADKLKEVRK